MQRKTVALSMMRNRQQGIVVGIAGGAGSISRLSALGIHTGSHIVKKSTLIGAGPVIAAVGNTEIAIGHGMASKVMVEVVE
ncbi:MAG: FeoA family protein [Eubacteriales bacterium]|nr:FeoA family protein [Eubacteriales bacterium]